jgi:hypothetical protein
MPETTTTTSLRLLSPGDKFMLRGVDYVLVQHRRTKTLIRNVDNGKDYLLAQSAQVVHIGTDLDTLSAAVNKQAERTARLDIPAGTKVRFVDNERTRRRGIAGIETVITRVNSKTYGLANGWRVAPEYVERVA